MKVDLEDEGIDVIAQQTFRVHMGDDDGQKAMTSH